MKICSKCKKEKNIDEFYNSKANPDGKTNRCKECIKIEQFEYRKSNPLKRKEVQKRYVLKNKDKIREKTRLYRKRSEHFKEYQKIWKRENYHKNRDKINKKRREIYYLDPEKFRKLGRESYQRNKEKRIEYQRNYRNKNIIEYNLKSKERRLKDFEFNKKISEYYKNRKKNDINFKIKCNLRTRLWAVLKGITKSAKTLELLGCSIDELKIHLQSQFKDGMNWENYGTFWEIDHIKACCLHDLTDSEQQKQCFHYTNLRPLEASLNLKLGQEAKKMKNSMIDFQRMNLLSV